MARFRMGRGERGLKQSGVNGFHACETSIRTAQSDLVPLLEETIQHLKAAMLIAGADKAITSEEALEQIRNGREL